MRQTGFKKQMRTIMMGAALAMGMGSTALMAQQPAAPAAPAAEPAMNNSKLSLTVGVDFYTHYFFRGILQENQGFIAQPYAEVGFKLFEADGPISSGTFKFGTWNSFHDNDTAAASTGMKSWYEADFYAGFSFGVMKDYTVDVIWTAYGSPNDGFDTIHDITLGFGYVGDNIVGKLAPSAKFYFEFDNQADAGNSEGVLLELGIEPAFELVKSDTMPITLSIPVKVGLSLSEYYESPTAGDTEDSTFGYASVGATLSLPLAFIPKDYGNWKFKAGVQYMILGSTTEEFNSGDDNEVIGMLGISMSF